MTTTARAAGALGFGCLGVAFILRSVGDTTALHWLNWCTPLGWAEQVGPYGDDRLWVLSLSALLFLVGWVVAAALLSRRDIGSGLLSERRGPAVARPSLSGAFGLSWRLDARWLMAWVVALGTFGIVVGSVTQALADLAAGNHLFARFLGGGQGSLTDLYLAQMLEMLSVLAAAAGVQSVLRARAEEEAGRAEELLATGMTRLEFLGSHLVLGAGGAALALLIPCLALVAASAALIGCAPRLSILALPLVIATYVLTSFGDVLGLPSWVLDLSVYRHIPRLPGGTADVAPLLVVGAITLVLTLGGLAGFRRRDLT